MGGRLKRKRIYVYLQLIHVVVQQKLTQHCKPIILQLKKNCFLLPLALSKNPFLSKSVLSTVHPLKNRWLLFIIKSSIELDFHLCNKTCLFYFVQHSLVFCFTLTTFLGGKVIKFTAVSIGSGP